jgi:hypothetical protein
MIDPQKFEYVLLVKFNDEFVLEKILQLDWQKFLKFKRWHSTMRAWNLSLTKALISECEIIFEK